MLEIKEDNKIFITQGDTLDLKIDIIAADGTQYIPLGSDTIRFALKQHYSDPQPLIIKTIDNSTLQLLLSSEETKSLSVWSSPYVWDIELSTASGTVDTFLQGTLTVTKEVC